MLIGIDSSPCSLSLRNRSTLCSTTKCHQNKSDLRNVFVQKSFFFNIFYSFNPNHAYWNQRRLFSGNLPGMFIFSLVGYLNKFFAGNFLSSFDMSIDFRMCCCFDNLTPLLFKYLIKIIVLYAFHVLIATVLIFIHKSVYSLLSWVAEFMPF